MRIFATVKNSLNSNNIVVSTNDNIKNISIPSKSSGQGSSINGGELLFLSLATCFCNDVYREADRRRIHIKSIEVSVFGDFGGEGEPASNISYKVNIQSDHDEIEINNLINHVDKVAEIHNTLRKGTKVDLIS
ncbi:MAG TPA: OsmC family protein [Ohtaekwangia sp.]|nr:OsmC family protein [Ohtaekwangia sp.]